MTFSAEKLRARKRRHYEKRKGHILARNKEWAEKNKEKVRAYQKAYYARPEAQERRRELYRLRIDHFKKRDRDHYYKTRDRHRELDAARRYKISVEEYRRMFEAQLSLCAICGKPETVKNKTLSVDHNHKTGNVRGLLCGHCNRAIGYLREDLSLLPKIQAYLEKYNA